MDYKKLSNKLTTTTIDLKSNSYDLKIGYNLLKKAGKLLLPIVQKRRVFIISDEKVAPLYLEELEKSLIASRIDHVSFIVPGGEKIKSFFWLEKICETILMGRIDRSSVIFALGGGVIGDLAGFASSIILRGVDFIQFPTTLLAQVDSSIGGKTAINTEYGKNVIGSFYQPRMVITDLTTLETLNLRQIKAGYAEIVKCALIRDQEFWHYLKKNGQKVINLHRASLHHAVLRSCEIKADIVSQDEKEKGLRALLNLGHSFGHALEAVTEFDENVLLHGEAVAIGILMALKLSEDLNLVSSGVFDEVRDHFAELGLLTDLKSLNNKIDWTSILEFMERDKKNHNGQIKLVLLKEIGNAFIYDTITSDLLKKSVEYFL